MIIFKKISWKNFLSTGDAPTTIFFDRTPTTLIIGENGSGKINNSGCIDIRIVW